MRDGVVICKFNFQMFTEGKFVEYWNSKVISLPHHGFAWMRANCWLQNCLSYFTKLLINERLFVTLQSLSPMAVLDLCARRTLGWTRYIYVHSRLNLLGNILSFNTLGLISVFKIKDDRLSGANYIIIAASCRTEYWTTSLEIRPFIGPPLIQSPTGSRWQSGRLTPLPSGLSPFT